jgi:hypothetical protein
MATNNTLISFGIIGAAVALLCGYMAHISVNVETYPDIEVTTTTGFDAPSLGSTELLRQGNSLTPMSFTPHRYPSTAGQNITTLIHHGLTPLSKHAPHDSKWIECPPANVMW